MAETKLMYIIFGFLGMVAVASILGTSFSSINNQGKYTNGTSYYYKFDDNFTSQFSPYVSDISSESKNILDQQEGDDISEEEAQDKYARTALLTVSAYKEFFPMFVSMKNSISKDIPIPGIALDVVIVMLVVFITFAIVFILWTRNKS